MKLDIHDTGYHLKIHQEDLLKPYLVMLHGFMGDFRSFQHLIEDLCTISNPVSIDLLGHGSSEKIHDPEQYSSEHQIAHLAQLLVRISDRPIIVYGYSMGGRLALKTAAVKPELFRGLILESTNPGITDHKEREERKAVDLERANEIEHDFEGFLNRWEKLSLFQSNTASNHRLSESYRQMQRAQDPKSMAASLRGFGTGFMIPVTASQLKYKGPALLLAGSEDRKYVASNKKMATFFTDVSTLVVPGGHRVHLDNPEKIIQHVTSFIKQHI